MLKVVGCVTDNASNYVSAFNRHGISLDDDDRSDSDDEDEMGDPVNFVRIDDKALPMHFRCASHTLNLIGTKDASNALTNSMYRMKFDQAFEKLNALCKKYNRPKSSELIKSILKSSLVKPCKTRWNSLYDSIARLLTFDVQLLNKTTEALSLENFSTSDLEFFREYMNVMRPIAESIDSLQADAYHSHFLPTLVNIKYWLESINAESNLKHCQPLLDAITDGFEKRFGHFFIQNDEESITAIVSTCVHPYFKTRWLHEDMNTDSYLKHVEEMLIREAILIEKGSAAPIKKLNEVKVDVKGMIFELFLAILFYICMPNLSKQILF